MAMEIKPFAAMLSSANQAHSMSLICLLGIPASSMRASGRARSKRAQRLMTFLLSLLGRLKAAKA